MVADHLIGIDKLETDLWKLADEPRANSNLASNEYFLTIMGLIFLRHATHRFDTARSAIEADKAAGKMPNRPLVAADFSRRRALMLSDRACYDVILKTPKDGNLGAALNAAMEAVEKTFPPLAGQFPKDYERFDNDLLDRMLRMFDGEALRTASGDVFGRIYEYFLFEFSKQGAHDNGKFFTPPLARADHRQCHRARSRHCIRSSLRLRRHVRAVQPFHRGCRSGHDETRDLLLKGIS